MHFPIKITVSNWATLFLDTLRDAIFGENELSEEIIAFGGDIYHVDYGQEYQAFCLNLHSELTYPLDIDHYLEKVGNALATVGHDKLVIPPYEFGRALGLMSLSTSIPVNRQELPIITLPNPLEVPPGVPADFLYAEIGSGSLVANLNLYSGTTVIDTFEITHTLAFRQADTPLYNGLNCVPGSLQNKYLNTNPIAISGTVSLSPKAGATFESIPADATLQIALTIQIQNLKILHWSFGKDNPIRNIPIHPVSLKDIAPYINYIDFREYDGNPPDTDTPDTGIGVSFNFSEVINGLQMALSCETINMPGDYRDLTKNKDIVFSSMSNRMPDAYFNESFFRLDMQDKPQFIENDTQLVFEMRLRPKNDSEVLVFENVNPQEPPGISGEGVFFQNWERAEVNMRDAIKAAFSDGSNIGKGVISQEPIHLSVMNDYLTGFSIEDMEARLYMSGPKNAIADVPSHISFFAYYTHEGKGKTVALCEPNANLMLDTKGIDLKNFLDEETKSIYIKSTLPGINDGIMDGISFDFSEITTDWPDNLRFEYEIIILPELLVYPYMFNAEEGEDKFDSKIIATIMLLMRLKLTAGEQGGRIGYNMFGEDANDLLGRRPDPNDPSGKRPEPNELFDYIDRLKLSVGFSSPFAYGGTLFIEKPHNAQLYPDGIPIDGSNLVLDITDAQMQTVREKLIEPDFRIEFGKGDSLFIPKNAGITSVIFEAKGIYPLPEF